MTGRISYRRPLGPLLALESPNSSGEALSLQDGSDFGAKGLPVETPLGDCPTRPEGEQVRVVIADDHPIFRDGLRRLIETQSGMCVAGESAVGVEVIRLVRAIRPDIVLLDLGLPRRSGLEVLSELTSMSPPVRTLVLAEEVEEGSILEAFYLGAHGLVLKKSPREALLKSIRSVIAGQYWLDHENVPIVIGALRKLPSAQNGATAGREYGLTPQELKIVVRVANGSSNKAVGHEFSISERTVKHHLTNVFNKLGISSRLELAVFAFEHGLVSKG